MFNNYSSDYLFDSNYEITPVPPGSVTPRRTVPPFKMDTLIAFRDVNNDTATNLRGFNHHRNKSSPMKYSPPKRQRTASCSSKVVDNKNIPKTSYFVNFPFATSSSSSSSNKIDSNDLRSSCPDLNRQQQQATASKFYLSTAGFAFKSSDGEHSDNGFNSDDSGDSDEIDDDRFNDANLLDAENEPLVNVSLLPMATMTILTPTTPTQTNSTATMAPSTKPKNGLPPGVGNILFTANGGPVDSPVTTLRQFTSDWDLDAIMNGDPKEIVKSLIEFSAINKIRKIPVDEKDALLREYFRGIKYDLNEVVKAAVQRFTHWELAYIWDKGTKHFDMATLTSILEAKIRNTSLPSKSINHQASISEDKFYCDNCGTVRMVVCDLCNRNWCISASCLEEYKKRDEIVCFLTKYCNACSMPIQTDIVNLTKKGFCTCSFDIKLDFSTPMAKPLL